MKTLLIALALLFSSSTLMAHNHQEPSFQTKEEKGYCHEAKGEKVAATQTASTSENCDCDKCEKSGCDKDKCDSCDKCDKEDGA